jgi:hypothetical protein
LGGAADDADFGVGAGFLAELLADELGRAGVDPPAGLKNDRIDPSFFWLMMAKLVSNEFA